MAAMSGDAQIDPAAAYPAATDPAAVDPAAKDIAFGDDPHLPGESFHRYLRARRDEGALVDVTMMGLPAKLVTRYAELDAAFRDDEGLSLIHI